MVSRRKLLSLPLLGVLAMLVGLALPAESQAQDKPKPPPPPKRPQNKPKPPPAVPGALQFQEANALRTAFIKLAAGNHDYNGHRWKAMHAVKAALVPLDNFVLKHGAAGLKVQTRDGQTAVASAEAAAKKAPTVREPQPASDALLGQAGKLLLQIRPTLVANKQPIVLKHVDTAIQEIKVALKVR
jgi:hypothetical protein